MQVSLHVRVRVHRTQASRLAATTLMDVQLEHKHKQHIKFFKFFSKHENSICKHDSCAQLEHLCSKSSLFSESMHHNFVCFRPSL